MNESAVVGGLGATWRQRLARVVEELFRATSSENWDDLLELRHLVLEGRDWVTVLDHFLVCRRQLERDHYLPFYRMRRLLEAHLRLETRGDGEAVGRRVGLALWRHQGMEEMRRRAEHEHHMNQVPRLAGRARVTVAVVEQAG